GPMSLVPPSFRHGRPLVPATHCARLLDRRACAPLRRPDHRAWPRPGAARRTLTLNGWPALTAGHDGREEDGILPQQPRKQVLPLSVVALDQVDLPIAPVLLQLLLAPDRVGHQVEAFEPDEARHPVALGEPLEGAVAVLVHPRDE